MAGGSGRRGACSLALASVAHVLPITRLKSSKSSQDARLLESTPIQHRVSMIDKGIAKVGPLVITLPTGSLPNFWLSEDLAGLFGMEFNNSPGAFPNRNPRHRHRILFPLWREIDSRRRGFRCSPHLEDPLSCDRGGPSSNQPPCQVRNQGFIQVPI